MSTEHRWPVMLLPGAVLPAQPAYEALLTELGDGVEARVKGLEIYAGETVPQPGYTLETEVEGIGRVADEASVRLPAGLRRLWARAEESEEGFGHQVD